MTAEREINQEMWRKSRNFRMALEILAISALVLMVAGMILSLTTSYGDHVFLLGIILYALHVPVREMHKKKLYIEPPRK